MRDHAKIEPQFWMRGSGKALRQHPTARLAALYLMSCPSANMIGLYPISLPTLAHDLGRPLEGAREDLQRVSEAGIAYYDEAAELVWVPRMASKQVAESLKPKDNRVEGVRRLAEQIGDHPFTSAFWDTYEKAFSLGPKPEWLLAAPFGKPLPSPSEAPSKPLRSQEQEQEQEQEQIPPSPRGGVGDAKPSEPAKGLQRPTRGTRIPDGWTPSPELLAWCHEQRVDGSAHVEEFRDYWTAKPGAGGVKLDWPATFRTWIRNAAKRGDARPWSPPPRSRVSTPLPPEEGPLVRLADDPRWRAFMADTPVAGPSPSRGTGPRTADQDSTATTPATDTQNARHGAPRRFA